MRDEAATKARRLSDPRSYVEDGHEYLFGMDKSRRRAEVYWRDGRRCVMCGEMLTWQTGEMDHIQSGLGKQRCDCLHNLRWVCATTGCQFHKKRHVQVGG